MKWLLILHMWGVEWDARYSNGLIDPDEGQFRTHQECIAAAHVWRQLSYGATCKRAPK